MRSSLKTTLSATAVAISAAFLCSGAAHAAFAPPVSLGPDFHLGDKTFSNFTCQASGGNTDTIGCAGVSYSPVTINGNYGVVFNPANALDLSGPGSNDIVIDFTVTVDPNSPNSIADFFLSSNALASGTGSVTDNLEICTDSSCSTILLQVLLTSPNINLPDFTFPATYKSIFVSDDIHTSVPTGTQGAVDISRLDKVVTQVPEPASALLVGSALLGLGFFGRRRRD